MSANLSRKLSRRLDRSNKTHCRHCHKLVRPEMKRLESGKIQICPECGREIDVSRRVQYGRR